MGLGSIAVSPLEMASAYATLAAGGMYSKPMAIRKVIFSNGKEDNDTGWRRPQRTRAVPAGVAYEVTRILEQNVLHGTGVGAYFGRPAAGKTGTTDNHADAWFCGYTPNLEATVWVGYPRAEIPMVGVHGISVTGGSFPATIWHLFMDSAIGSTPPKGLVPPRGVPGGEQAGPRPARREMRAERVRRAEAGAPGDQAEGPRGDPTVRGHVREARLEALAAGDSAPEGDRSEVVVLEQRDRDRHDREGHR